MRPDFLVIGAMKCATSTVCAYLEDHPDVFMVAGADPDYFSVTENYEKGHDTYRRLFAERGTAAIAGEGSNSYSARALHPETAERIKLFDPDMKLVYMVRHPLERLASAWVQNRVDSGDAVPPSLDEAVRALPDRYVGMSLYWYNLQPFRDRFPENQIFVGFMEDMKRDPTAFFADLNAFLEITPFDMARPHLNPSSGKKVPGRLYSSINGSWLGSVSKSLVPPGVRTMVKSRLLSRDVDALPGLSPQTRRQVLDVIEPDARMFLSHHGKPDDFWKF